MSEQKQYLLHFDFETRSRLDLGECGLDRYVNDPTTEILCLAWAVNDAPVLIWEPHKNPFPREIEALLKNPSVTKVAWNSSFERNILKSKLGISVPLSDWLDPMVMARYLSMPGYLEEVSTILGIDNQKYKWGTQKEMGQAQKLLTMFCLPARLGGEETLFGIEEDFYRDWNTNPREWAELLEYCKRDVEAERECFHKMRAFILPETERRGWILDQEINSRGVYCDLELVRGARAVASKEKEILQDKLLKLTGVSNPNSGPQILEWAQSQGYAFSSIAKPFVARALNGECNLTPEAKMALQIRQQSAKTSDSKLDKILSMVGPDNRLRYQFAYMGAARTGRWSGGNEEAASVQLQNLSRPTKAVEKALDRVLELLRAGNHEQVVKEFGNPLEVVASAVRSNFKAAPGKKLVVCDLSAIENRGVGYVAECDAILKVFRDKLDPYIDFATRMYHLPYSEITKLMRQMAKPAVLGCGYQLSGGERLTKDNGEVYYTGLLAYARNMGIELTREEAHNSVDIFRSSYPEIADRATGFWTRIEEACFAAVQYNEKTELGCLRIQCLGGKILRILLPSGRGLHYIRPKIELREIDAKNGETYEKESITFEGKDQKTHQWVRIPTYGGKLTENVVQAISRDILLNGMLLADKMRLPIVMTAHDEIVAEVDENDATALDRLKEAMTTPPDWAKDFPLDAAGFETIHYKKE